LLRLALRLAKPTMHALKAAIGLPMSRLNRLRERRAAARRAKPRKIADHSDDGRGFGTAWGALAPA
jgi:hypothetical protein